MLERAQRFRGGALTAVCGAMAVWLSGCAGPIRPSGFLPDYASLQQVEGVNLLMRPAAMVEVPTTPALIAIDSVEWVGRNGGPARGRTARLASFAERRLSQYCREAALARYPSPTIVTFERDLRPYEPFDGPAYRLEVAVTEVRPGSGLLRYVLGYYLGAAVMQAEFRLREARSNRLLAIFATRRLHPGYSKTGLNLRALSAAYCLDGLAADIAHDLVEAVDGFLLPRTFHSLSPTDS